MRPQTDFSHFMRDLLRRDAHHDVVIKPANFRRHIQRRAAAADDVLGNAVALLIIVKMLMPQINGLDVFLISS